MTEPEPVQQEIQAEPAPAAMSGKARDRQRHQLHQWGNYHNYYFHRTPSIPDARLSLLPPPLFASKRVLDLGCNAGKLTLEVVQHLSATSSHGVDLDAVLIERAQALAVEQKVEATCSFACVDFMQDPAAFFNGLEGEKFDTVLLLSITKWLHLHHGDSGLLSLFRALHAYLVRPDGDEGGVLVVEPQEWENYVKAVNKNRNLRPMFATLGMRPPFEAEMRAEGFVLEKAIEREEGGFSRPLMVWRAVPK